MSEFATQPPKCTVAGLTFPASHVMLVTINRERAMNSMTMGGHWEGQAIWNWFDNEPSLRVAIITGKGDRAFSAGQDLKEALTLTSGPNDMDPTRSMPPSGFFGLSRRVGKKPVVAAVNGFAHGGGFEMCLNCDIVIASPGASFSVPEIKRGLFAAAGGIARLVRTFGMQLASDLALTGREISAQSLERYGFLRVSSTQASLLSEALEAAEAISSQSPDAIIVTRAGLRDAWESPSVERSSQLLEQRYLMALKSGENIKIGLQAFANKEQPEWVPSKL